MNIHYIRAAIYANIGILLTLEQTKQYLISEGMVAERNADRLIFSGYKEYYGRTVSVDASLPIDDVIEQLPDDVVAAVAVALNGVI